MTYEGIEYAIRAGLGRNEWVLLISFPDNPKRGEFQRRAKRL